MLLFSLVICVWIVNWIPLMLCVFVLPSQQGHKGMQNQGHLLHVNLLLTFTSLMIGMLDLHHFGCPDHICLCTACPVASVYMLVNYAFT